LLAVRRRRLTARGVQPVGAVPHVFAWFYVYGAVEPTTGARFFLELPYLNAESFQLFIDAFAQAFPDSLHLLLLDNSGAHTAQRLSLPRMCLAIEVGGRVDANRVIEVLKGLIHAYSMPRYIRSDNGPQFVAKAIQSWLATTAIGTAYIEPGKPWQNRRVESFIGKFRDVYLNMEWLLA
jgi:hypothetical protein